MKAGHSICVAGAGVLGLASAVTLARSGVEVLLLDPDEPHPNASAVAAGLLAPVGEALFDASTHAHYPLLAEAMSLWPAFAQATGLTLAEGGVAIPEAFIGQAQALGVGVEPHPFGALVRSDLRVADPPEALRTLRAAFVAAGGRFEARGLSPDDLGTHRFTVIATGAQSLALTALAPELRHLQPVKGQIAVLPQGPVEGPAVRWPGGYMAPHPSGARVGATMEPGRTDTAVEPEVISGLLAAALAHAPGLNGREVRGEAGVRMQTPDGLPLVGPSTTPGVLIATGARRNGWLFAPLVARMIAAYCMGRDAGAWAEALHPARFDETIK